MRETILAIKRVTCEVFTLAFILCAIGLDPLPSIIEGGLGVLIVYMCVWLKWYMDYSRLNNGRN